MEAAIIISHTALPAFQIYKSQGFVNLVKGGKLGGTRTPVTINVFLTKNLEKRVIW